ncbi:RNA 2',3'-cyclic phosphodiesterase [Ruegeria hyattellae]|uniref:RNA 2',3'-cyclic phosphodiesterase n=1 Tax=Ruegeria hyattellae TaxID=3233337 RepID=UPI00355C3DE5
MRSFVATSLSDETMAALAPLQRGLPVGQTVPPENMHLTLVFLDDQPKEALETLHEELLMLSTPPFSVTFSGIERIGRVLAVRVADCASLIALHRKIQTATRRAGIVLPHRRFRPHVTIARLKKDQRETVQHVQSACIADALPDMPVTGFTLFQSTLRPEGARHDALAHYTLS